MAAIDTAVQALATPELVVPATPTVPGLESIAEAVGDLDTILQDAAEALFNAPIITGTVGSAAAVERLRSDFQVMLDHLTGIGMVAYRSNHEACS